MIQIHFQIPTYPSLVLLKEPEVQQMHVSETLLWILSVPPPFNFELIL